MVSVSTIHVHAVSECVHRQALCTLGEALPSISRSKDTYVHLTDVDRTLRIISLANLANVLTFYVRVNFKDVHPRRTDNEVRSSLRYVRAM